MDSRMYEVTDIIDDFFEVLKRHNATKLIGTVALEIALIATLQDKGIDKGIVMDTFSRHWDELAEKHYDA